VLAVEHPAVVAAREVADSLLRPQAEQVDKAGVHAATSTRSQRPD
jgi:hypothetical protein